jgi:hypothetical protein
MTRKTEISFAGCPMVQVPVEPPLMLVLIVAILSPVIMLSACRSAVTYYGTQPSNPTKNHGV